MSHRVRMVLLAVAGVVMALGPMVALDYVVRWVAIEQGTARLESMADTMAAHADIVLDTAADALTILSHGGVDKCNQENLRFIAEAVFTRLPLKEIGIYDSDGRILCSNFGPTLLPVARDKAVAVKGGQLALSMIPTRVEGHMALGLRRDSENGGGGVVAIIESSAVLMELLHGDLRESCHARVELADGTLIGQSGQTRDDILAQDRDMIEIRRASARYPVIAAVAAPRAVLIAPYLPLARYTKIGGGAIGAMLLLFIGLTAHRRPTLEADIDAAISGGEFLPFYQPVIDAEEGRVSGCEVLLRWRKSNGDMVQPDIFVPFAETTGQIIEITRELMYEVREDLAEIGVEDVNFTVSINLVAEHFANRDIVSDVQRIFASSEVGPQNLVFEITERHPLRDLKQARAIIAELQSMGCKIALDDAGTGHGGLAYMQELRMDEIKIDRMFISAIGNDAAKAPIVDALMELGKQLEMKIIAEGVETEEQFAYLRRRGARYFQGFLFAPPMPAESFRRFVAALSTHPTDNAATYDLARAAAG